MSYKVLSRKFRPQNFDEIIGQSEIKKILLNALSHDRVGHAYLFVGTRGIGKTTITRILAKSLNCLSSGEKKPCNKCENCLEFNRGNSLDCVEIDGASNNSVDHIRELREITKYPPTKAKYRIFIIDEVHMLTTQAWNALLKVLEEPPEYVKFFFATTESHKILPTILSRCQRLELKSLSAKEIFDYLKSLSEQEKININSEALNVLVKIADGSMRDALSALEQTINLSPKEEEITALDVLNLFARISYNEISLLLKYILNESFADVIVFIDELAKKGVDLEQFFYDFLHYLRNLVVVCFNPQKAEKILQLDEKEFCFFKRLE